MKSIIKEIIIKQLKENKMEPLEITSLLRYVSRLTESQLELIVNEGIENHKQILMNQYKQGKISKDEANLKYRKILSKFKNTKDKIVNYTLII